MIKLHSLTYFMLALASASVSIYVHFNPYTNQTKPTLIAAIHDSAIVLPNEFEQLSQRQSRIVQAEWFVIAYSAFIEPWTDQTQLQSYYQQQKSNFDNLDYETLAPQLALDLAHEKAIQSAKRQAQLYSGLLMQGKRLGNEQKSIRKHQSLTWVSAYSEDTEADIVRILLVAPVNRWHINSLPNGDVLISRVVMRDLEQSRLGLARRLNENALFGYWQNAEQRF